MPSAVRAITRIQDADDFTGSLTDTYIPVWSNSQQKFVMTAQSVTAPGGSSGYIQYNNAGAFGASGVYWDAVNSRLGLGTSTPTAAAEIVGKTIFGTYGLFDPSLFNEMTLGHKNLAAFSTNFAFGQNSSGQTIFNGAELYFRTANNTKMYLSPIGRLGINTISPSQALDVNGSVNVATALIVPVVRPASDSTTALKVTKADGTTAVVTVDTTNSRVGIGGTPSYLIHAQSGGAWPAANIVVQSSTSTAGARFSAINSGGYGIYFNMYGPTFGVSALANKGGFGCDNGIRVFTDANVLSGGSSDIELSAGGYDSVRMTVKSSGNVGIGTTSPNNRLDVVGTIQMDGLRIDVTPTSETVTATHTVTFSANGTNYKLLCVPA